MQVKNNKTNAVGVATFTVVQGRVQWDINYILPNGELGTEKNVLDSDFLTAWSEIPSVIRETLAIAFTIFGQSIGEVPVDDHGHSISHAVQFASAAKKLVEVTSRLEKTEAALAAAGLLKML